MRIIEYNKLVRDDIPRIIEKNGKRAVVEKLDDERYFNLLERKLGEELEEYLESKSVEELADLVEVVYALLDFKKVSLAEFEQLRKDKLARRGGFRQRLLLKHVIGD